ncbi:MAG: macrolide transporter ATP-binding protein [Firmicutes bacterium]|nr:macrolide transporter ATP-binding protein [Bacillota bacterium]
MSFIRMVDCHKRYKMGSTTIVANNGIDFEIEKGEFVVIVGPSGAGKSTVLNILGGMDTCDEGQVIIDGKATLENVELSAQIVPGAKDPQNILESVGLGGRLDNFPAQLSGGEQQRVAIARALAKNPKLLLADEPTGALDYHTGKSILKLLQNTCKDTGTTVIVITHNQAITPIADRVIEINDAKVRRMIINEHPVSIDVIEW